MNNRCYLDFLAILFFLFSTISLWTKSLWKFGCSPCSNDLPAASKQLPVHRFHLNLRKTRRKRSKQPFTRPRNNKEVIHRLFFSLPALFSTGDRLPESKSSNQAPGHSGHAWDPAKIRRTCPHMSVSAPLRFLWWPNFHFHDDIYHQNIWNKLKVHREDNPSFVNREEEDVSTSKYIPTYIFW